MLPFAGWEMPIQYQGIVAEHGAVRSGVGVFDISHMGEFEVSGPGAAAWLDGLLTNEVAALAEGEGHYSLLLNEMGGVIDDLILYRTGAERFFLVVNAARIEQDREWLLAHPAEGVVFADRSAEFGALAVQGPASAELWSRLGASLPLPPRNGIAEGGGLVLCRTGYTGEDGFELFASTESIGDWFDRLLEAGAIPCGLGARDTLRLEKAYPLNGSDLDEARTPLEAGLGFFVKLDKPDGFVGREALLAQRAAGVLTRLAAVRMLEKGPPPRHGYAVLSAGGDRLGELTSGSLSPSLGLGIGLAYLPAASAKPGTPLLLEVRGKTYPAEVVRKPFF
jgi:aminomethyltransferase